MLAVDLAAIRLLRRRRGLWAWCGAMVVAGSAAILLGICLGEDPLFGTVRLWTYGVFLHATLLLAATAILWRCERRALSVAAALAALALPVVAGDAFLIEPHWLEVTHRRIASPKIRHPIRIVVLADLQCNELGEYERAALRRALAEKPDILLLAGDYVEVPWEQEDSFCRQLHDFLKEIGLGSHERVFAVQGNVDPSNWLDIFAGLNVTAVADRQTFDLAVVARSGDHATTKTRSGDPVVARSPDRATTDLQLTCLSLAESRDRSLTVANPSPERFHIVLGHRPDYAMGAIDADLLIAGHTHGGQVRLPWIGPLITLSRVPRSWAGGLTELPGGGELLVSRGIGVERSNAPPMRFLCRPELAVVDLLPAEKEAPQKE
jgi:uncharacterized protein